MLVFSSFGRMRIRYKPYSIDAQIKCDFKLLIVVKRIVANVSMAQFPQQ